MVEAPIPDRPWVDWEVDVVQEVGVAVMADQPILVSRGSVQHQ